MSALECPICLELPPGEVHQCTNGHCYCVQCFNVINPRRCPECRERLPRRNRSIAQERVIGALPATCAHCGEATTRGEQAEHERRCPQRPTVCCASELGCAWAGPLAEQAAHEAACPLVECQRRMAQLQAETETVRAEKEALRARVAVLEPLQAQNEALRAEKEALQARVAALEAGEQGGRRQRRRVGAAPHDAPPSVEAVRRMGVAAVAAALRVPAPAVPIAEAVCMRLGDLCNEARNRQLAMDAGAIEGVVAVLRIHRQAEGVQAQGCFALFKMCVGTDAAALARKQRSVDAGALEVVVAALRAHPQVAEVQEWGCLALNNMCSGTDAAALARKQRSVDAGALEVVVAALRAHPQVAAVQERGCFALGQMCFGIDDAGHVRRQRAVQSGAVAAVTAAMQAHPQVERVQLYGQMVHDLLAVV